MYSLVFSSLAGIPIFVPFRRIDFSASLSFNLNNPLRDLKKPEKSDCDDPQSSAGPPAAPAKPDKSARTTRPSMLYSSHSNCTSHSSGFCAAAAEALSPTAASIKAAPDFYQKPCSSRMRKPEELGGLPTEELDASSSSDGSTLRPPLLRKSSSPPALALRQQQLPSPASPSLGGAVGSQALEPPLAAGQAEHHQAQLLRAQQAQKLSPAGPAGAGLLPASDLRYLESTDSAVLSIEWTSADLSLAVCYETSPECVTEYRFYRSGTAGTSAGTAGAAGIPFGAFRPSR